MKRFYLVALCCLVSWGIFAHERSVEQAAQIAAQFTNQTPSLRNRHMAPCSASTLRLAHTRAKLNSTAPAFYVFNQEMMKMGKAVERKTICGLW